MIAANVAINLHQIAVAKCFERRSGTFETCQVSPAMQQTNIPGSVYLEDGAHNLIA